MLCIREYLFTDNAKANFFNNDFERDISNSYTK